MSSFVKVTAKSEVPVNEGRVFDVKGQQIAVFNVNGQFCAVDNICPHRGGPLGEGAVQGSVVTCPWHGWQFDVTTGVSPVNPAAKVRKFNCKVEGEAIQVEVD
ncbi:MAG: Rieske 2Fe-2S domain-containing protein [Deltaproteobacteria bacterium]|nr:Rieske 2Fe-2S domain-containing protein [Deltaproteobacteria bacterium]MBI2500360.1 Rieske 2Fe-2S domain-containing protein [Deltaproteobacteria bacterium]